MTYTYRTRGTCSQQIEVELDGDVIQNVKFYGGCNGNTQGVARLVCGRKVDEVIDTFGYPLRNAPDLLPRPARARAQRSAEGAAVGGIRQESKRRQGTVLCLKDTEPSPVYPVYSLLVSPAFCSFSAASAARSASMISSRSPSRTASSR